MRVLEADERAQLRALCARTSHRARSDVEGGDGGGGEGGGVEGGGGDGGGSEGGAVSTI